MLNYNWGQCKDPEFVRKDNQVTEVILWACLHTGISNITETNYKEFYARINFYEKVFGTRLMRDGKDRPITLDDVKKRIGFWTNNSDLTRTEFLKRCWKWHFEDIDFTPDYTK